MKKNKQGARARATTKSTKPELPTSSKAPTGSPVTAEDVVNAKGALSHVRRALSSALVSVAEIEYRELECHGSAFDKEIASARRELADALAHVRLVQREYLGNRGRKASSRAAGAS